jgi:hypothetical protein
MSLPSSDSKASKCKAELFLGGTYFDCQLDEGHSGNHADRGEKDRMGPHKWVLLWTDEDKPWSGRA